MGIVCEIIDGKLIPVAECRKHKCYHCCYEWLEYCDADDYPCYCPHCGEELFQSKTVNDCMIWNSEE